MAKSRKPTPADHLSGKRRWTRQPITIDVVCVGTGTTIRGRTIDVSRGGMLLEALDGDVPPIGDQGLVPLAYLVALAFSDGMNVTLGTDVSVDAEVIRVTTSPVDNAFLRLGCHFRRSLTRKECARLGIDDRDVPDPALDLGGDVGASVGKPRGVAEAPADRARPTASAGRARSGRPA